MRVLIVDDSKPVRSILAKMLRQLDYDVVEASNGQEALRRLSELDASGQLDGLDLATINWQMPVMDGLQLIREIRSDARFRHLPLVLISAESDQAKLAAALAAGASDYLLKPCDASSLVKCLRKLGLPAGDAALPPRDARGPTRILIVDDSSVVRRVLARSLEDDPELQVVGAAVDGRDALRLLETTTPDIVLLDIEMPVLDGLETLKLIRLRQPKLPVIMFSSLTERGAKATLDALFLGANDYVPKPGGPEMADPEAGRQIIRQQLVPRIKQFRLASPLAAPASIGPASIASASTGSDSTGPASARASANPLEARPSDARQASGLRHDRPPQRIDILAIAASTGGPAALGRLLTQLSADIVVPIVVVQHMPPLFTRYLADRLAVDSKLDVKEATDGEVLGPGQTRVAAGGRHLTVRRRDRTALLKLTDAPPENACRPSADVLLRSVADAFGGASLAIILTGMGKDGLAGCEQIRQKGGQILAQDEASSVVWGMPGHVARAGLADAVLPLDQLAAEIKRRLRMGRREQSR